MNFKEIKKYVYDNEKIVYVLESIECHHITYHDKGYWTCGNCDGDNTSAVVIYNEPSLHIHNYTRNFKNGSDIFELIKYNLEVINNKKVTLFDSLKYLNSLFGFECKYQGTKMGTKFDPLAIFKKVAHSKQYSLNENDIDQINIESNFDYQEGIIHENWLNAGLTNKTIEKFKIGYSYKLKRIIIPLRMWNTGEIIGFNKRTIIKNYDILGFCKFLLTPNYPKSINLYGLYENMKSIQQNKICILFEAEKSVLRRDSRNDSNSVALQGHSISKEQVSIICGLDINEVVIAMDKDIYLNEVRSLCEKFYLKKNVSYIYDKFDLLDDKDSPADANDKIYKYLFETRVQYDEVEHHLYLKNIERKD